MKLKPSLIATSSFLLAFSTATAALSVANGTFGTVNQNALTVDGGGWFESTIATEWVEGSWSNGNATSFPTGMICLFDGGAANGYIYQSLGTVTAEEIAVGVLAVTCDFSEKTDDVTVDGTFDIYAGTMASPADGTDIAAAGLTSLFSRTMNAAEQGLTAAAGNASRASALVVGNVDISTLTAGTEVWVRVGRPSSGAGDFIIDNLTATAEASALSVTNGTFGTVNQNALTVDGGGWFESTITTNWVEGSWANPFTYPAAFPDGSGMALLMDGAEANGYTYQSLGTVSAGETAVGALTVTCDFSEKSDDVTVDGTFDVYAGTMASPAHGTDIAGAGLTSLFSRTMNAAEQGLTAAAGDAGRASAVVVGNVDISTLAPGTEVWIRVGRPSSGAGDFIIDNLTATVITSGFSAWSLANAGGQAINLDFDNDGVANGIEYFMGETGSSFTANPGLIGNQVSWPKDASYTGIYGTDFKVQTSPNLSSWTDVLAGDPNLSNTSPLGYTFPTGETKIFTRLVVTGP